MTKFMKSLAIVLLVVGFIASIVAGAMIQTPTFDRIGRPTGTVFNFYLFLGCLSVAFVLFGILYSIGSMHGLLEKIAMQTVPPASSSGKKDANAHEPAKAGYVSCKRCGEENKSFEIYCSSCGQKL